MYSISKKFSFSASHQLAGLKEGHPCMRLHGHNYEVELILYAHRLDEHGFVVDYNDMQPFADYIAQKLDHRHLNDMMYQPSAEYLAKHLYDVALELWSNPAISVRVSETPKTWAEYGVIEL